MISMGKLIILCIIISVTLGCNSSKLKYWDTSRFNFKPGALKDNAEIKLLYTSERPPSASELEYYIHLVAVSKETGETINILTTADNGLTTADSSTVFVYFDENNVMTKLFQATGQGGENPPDLNIDSISRIKLRDIKKVIRNPAFDHIADNNFPTVIGSIGYRKMPGQ
jgi:hypothetical protein